ncbi:MAG: N-acetylmuramidase domain-containing protein [Bauldia sp.]
MNFIGKGVRLQPGDFARALAALPGVEEAALRAVISVETAGKGFDGRGRPDPLFERHLFWAELGNTPARAEAAKKGLAVPKWPGPGTYPRTKDGVYAQIDAAAAIDLEAALRATSWGLGQILGRGCLEAGYPTALAMVQAFMDGEFAQLMAMVRLIKARGLDKALAGHNWAAFALPYNGAAYARNHYDTRLAEAFVAWTRRLARSPDVKEGPAGDDAVESVQRQLAALGLYEGDIDGLAGRLTQNALEEFQVKHGLPVTGIADGKTRAALVRALAPAPPSLIPAPGRGPGQAPASAPPPPPLAKPPPPQQPHAPAVATGTVAGTIAASSGLPWWGVALIALAAVAAVYLAPRLIAYHRKG